MQNIVYELFLSFCTLLYYYHGTVIANVIDSLVAMQAYASTGIPEDIYLRCCVV